MSSKDFSPLFSATRAGAFVDAVEQAQAADGRARNHPVPPRGRRARKFVVAIILALTAGLMAWIWGN